MPEKLARALHGFNVTIIPKKGMNAKLFDEPHNAIERIEVRGPNLGDLNIEQYQGVHGEMSRLATTGQQHGLKVGKLWGPQGYSFALNPPRPKPWSAFSRAMFDLHFRKWASEEKKTK